MKRKKNLPSPCPVSISHKTGGCKHISEEGLSKYNDLLQKLDDDYLTKDEHVLRCQKNESDMKLYIEKTMNSHTDTILTELRRRK